MRPLLAAVAEGGCIGGAPENRTRDAFVGAAVFKTVSSSMPDLLLLKWHPRQDLHLEPQPLEPSYASLLHLAGMEMNGGPGR